MMSYLRKAHQYQIIAKNLVFAVFEKEELIDCNCSGAHERKSLESDPRMDLIKETTFKKLQQKIGRSHGLHVHRQLTVLYANSDSNQHDIYCNFLIFYYVHISPNIYSILHVFKNFPF